MLVFMVCRLAHSQSTGWADEFALQRQQQQQLGAGPSTSAAAAGPSSWAEEFATAHKSEGEKWAEELGAQLDGGKVSEAQLEGEEAARAQSARLVAALTADGDPKMKSSKFLHFLSKMSRGELSFQDNKVGGAKTAPLKGWLWRIL
jgi:peroxin-5